MPQEPWIERLVRYQYLEPLLAGKRVLEIGCGTGRGADLLAGYAGSVHALETSAVVLGQARQTNARPNLHFLVGEPDKLDFPEHSFDAVLVPELQRWMTNGGLLPALRTLLDPSGHCIFSVPSADAGATQGLSYADLVEYLAQGFESVELFGEIPFSGTIMAAFEPREELEPMLECSLVDEDDLPQCYLAICGHARPAALGYAVVQMPQSSFQGPGELGQLRSELERTRQRLRHAEARADEWAQSSQAATTEVMQRDEEIEALQVRVQQFESELTAAKRGVGVLEQLADLRAERDDLERRVTELKRRVDGAAAHGDQELREQLAEAERRALGEANRARAEVTQARRESREQSEKATRAEEELVAVRKALAEARSLLKRGGAADGSELDELRGELRQATDASQARIKELEAQLASRSGKAPAQGGEAMRRWGESLNHQLERERERADRERSRAEEASDSLSLLQAKIELERARAENAERTLAEVRETVRTQRERAQSAEQRADSLVSRVEQGASELTRLHQRIAELQGLRQSDRWRMDELTGRLHAAESKKDTSNVPRLLQLEAELERAHNELSRANRELEHRDESAGRAAPIQGAGAELQGDLSRSLARIRILEGRVDQLLQELSRVSADAAGVGPSADSLVVPAGSAKEEALAGIVTRTDEGEGGEQVSQLLRDRLAGRERELRQLREAQVELTEELNRLRNTIAQDEPWEGQELLRVRQRQLDALMDGAALHREESQQLRRRIEELEELARERETSHQAALTAAEELERRREKEEQRAGGYRAELVAQGRQLAQLKGELLRLRRLERSPVSGATSSE